MSVHVEYLKHRCFTTLKWRQKIGKKYAFDFRIPLACKLLEQLASQPNDTVTPATLAELSKFSGPAFVDAVQEASREVAFKYSPQSLDELAQCVIKKMSPTPSDEFAELTRGTVASAANDG